MMRNSLLLFYSNDAESIKNDLILQLEGIPIFAIAVDDPKSLSQKISQIISKSKIQLIFFSPDFLHFLECRPEEAYSVFKHLEPVSTVAVFCCGLYEHQVMCYHIAPLKSYNSWPKFEVRMRNEKGQKKFPLQLLQRIKEVFPRDNLSSRNVTIVPEIIDKDCSTIFTIFTNPVDDLPGLNVHMEWEHKVQITPEIVNPYVARFKIPSSFLEGQENITIRIQQLNIVLGQQTIRIMHKAYEKEVEVVTENKPSKRKMSKEEVILEEQLQFLSDFVQNTDDFRDECTIQKTIVPQNEDDVIRSLTALCKKYGLEELSLFIKEPETPIKNCETDFDDCEFLQQDFCYPETWRSGKRCSADNTYLDNKNILHFPDEELDGHSSMNRSFSLPSIIPEVDNDRDDYLCMGGTNTGSALNLFPPLEFNHEDDELHCSLTNNGYVYMKWPTCRKDSLEAVKNHLSESQVELLQIMHKFKHGDATISDVEEQFQNWNRRHEGNLKPEGKSQKNATPFFFDWKNVIQLKPRKTNLKTPESEKRFSLTETDKNSSSRASSRKVSNASASSFSSKTSESSTSTIYSRHTSGVSKEKEISTGWVPFYSTCRQCPLNPEKDPPPPPPKPLLMCPITDEYPEIKPPFEKMRKLSTESPSIIQKDVNNELPGSQLPVQNDGKDKVRTLLLCCQKYGLEDLGDFFISEMFAENRIDAENIIEDLNYPAVEKCERTRRDTITDSQMCLHVTSNEWDSDPSLSLFRRSLSLPNTLLVNEVPAEQNAMKNSDSPTVNEYEDKQEKSLRRSFNDTVISSLTSNIYASVKSQIESGQNPALLKCSLSSSQQELLEILHAFKRGEKTISQVENQFGGWHQRHLNSSSNREKEILQLRSEYEKANKSNMFGLPGIKNFILGKPKKKIYKSATAPKRRKGKSESDTKRLSKISLTSTSSGVSDNSDVSRNVGFFNEEYGEYQEEKVSKDNAWKLSQSPKRSKPPPLPYRPPPTWVSSPSLEPTNTAKPLSKTSGQPFKQVPAVQKPKPKLAPKPLKILNKSYTLDICENQKQMASDENEKSGLDSTPGSPDYIIPNKVRFFPPNRRLQTKKLVHQKNIPSTPPPICSSSTAHKNKTTEVFTLVTCPVIKRTASSFKFTENGSNKDLGASQKRPFLKIPSPWSAKPQKKEESMFYIASRRWSSFPDLRSSAQPIYLELLDSKEDPRSDSKLES